MIKFSRNIGQRVIVSLLFLITFQLKASVSFCSWNIENFGKSKTDADIEFIANALKNFDIVAIIEVVAGDGGAQGAVLR